MHFKNTYIHVSLRKIYIKRSKMRMHTIKVMVVCCAVTVGVCVLYRSKPTTTPKNQWSTSDNQGIPHNGKSKPGQHVLTDVILTAYDANTRSKLEQLIRNKADARHPELIQLARDIIIGPSSNLILKIHPLRVVQTPQAIAVDNIFRRKVWDYVYIFFLYLIATCILLIYCSSVQRKYFLGMLIK
jgi:hypothetical protein